MIKVDLITGFLGSGKTTFIKKYVRYLLDKGEKIGIIENDYGAINVDMLLLNKEFGDECGMEMVVANDPDCHRRRFKTKLIAMGMDGVNDGKYDRIVVEPSGIYDVDEFFDILYEEPLDRFYEIGNVIAIVDAGLSDELSKESDYLLVSQIAEAGMVVFSKVDSGSGLTGNDGSATETVLSGDNKTTELEVSGVANVIDHMNRALERFKCGRRYELGCDECGTNDDGENNSEQEAILKNGAVKYEKYTAKDIMVRPWDNLTADDFERIENCGYVPEDHIKLHVAEDNGYRSLFYFHVKMSEEELKNMAAGLLSDESFGNIYRIKGFVPEENTNHKNDKQFDTYVEINATRKQVEINRTDKGQEVIIVIGEGLDNARIEGYIRRYSLEKDITAGQSNH